MNFPQLLVTIPFIFSTRATEPLPSHFVERKEYRDITTTLVESIPDPEDEKCTHHKVHIKNTGEGYIKEFSMFSAEGYTNHYRQCIDGSALQNQVIAPGQEVDEVFDVYYSVESLDDVTIVGYAYVDFTDEVNYTCGEHLESLNSVDENLYHYRVDMVLDAENGQYCYGAIIKIKHEDIEYYFEADLVHNFSFTTPVEFKDDDSVEVIKIVKTEYRYSSYYGDNYYNQGQNKDCARCKKYGQDEELNPLVIIIPVSSIILVGIGTIAFFSIRSSRKNGKKKDIIS